MAKQPYFNKFNTITYANNTALNLLGRVAISPLTKGNAYNYYRYKVLEGQRPDFISGSYYQDPYASWMIYMANDIVDPYYDWPMDDNTFVDFIRLKYGSSEDANRRVKYYRVNWYTDESELSIDAYNALGDLQKYWYPVYMESNVLVHYKRKPIDTIVNTNYNMQFNLETMSSAFEDEVIVKVMRTGSKVGEGEVVYSNTSSVILKNISSTVSNFADGDVIVSYTDGKEAAVSGTPFEVGPLDENGDVVRSVPLTDAAYWEPVTYYQYEQERNLDLSDIKLINSSLYNTITRQLKDDLK